MIRFTCVKCKGNMMVITKANKVVMVCPECQHTHLFKEPIPRVLSPRLAHTALSQRSQGDKNVERK